jgi:hypothetical protein
VRRQRAKERCVWWTERKPLWPKGSDYKMRGRQSQCKWAYHRDPGPYLACLAKISAWIAGEKGLEIGKCVNGLQSSRQNINANATGGEQRCWQLFLSRSSGLRSPFCTTGFWRDQPSLIVL